MRLAGKKIWAVLFIAAAAAGMFMLIWSFMPREDDAAIRALELEEGISTEGEIVYGPVQEEKTEKNIPGGMKAVNIPVNYFGDPSVLEQGDRVDIISTYYREEEGGLYSERIITYREIIRLETKGRMNEESSMASGDLFIPELSGTAADIGNIVVMTFFLTDDEVLKSFTALASGMLYIALCPAYASNEKGGY
jgi:hypothetical protein